MRDREPSPLCRFAPVVALIEGLRPRATHIPTALIEGLRSRAALVTTPQCCVYIPAPSFRASLNGSGCRVVAPGRVGWARVGGVSVFRFLGSGFLSWALAFWLFGFLASVFAFSVPFPVWLASGLPLRRPVWGWLGHPQRGREFTHRRMFRHFRHFRHLRHILLNHRPPAGATLVSLFCASRVKPI